VAEAGGSLADVVKLNVFLTDLANFAKVNETMAQYFSEPSRPVLPLASRSCRAARWSRPMR
jgi:enamine deaminase RidA (YjgF/YER057c/UK114 family)